MVLKDLVKFKPYDSHFNIHIISSLKVIKSCFVGGSIQRKLVNIYHDIIHLSHDQQNPIHILLDGVSIVIINSLNDRIGTSMFVNQ